VSRWYSVYSSLVFGLSGYLLAYFIAFGLKLCCLEPVAIGTLWWVVFNLSLSAGLAIHDGDFRRRWYCVAVRRSKLPVIHLDLDDFIEAGSSVPLIPVLFMASDLALPIFFTGGLEFNKLTQCWWRCVCLLARIMAETIRGVFSRFQRLKTKPQATLGRCTYITMVLVICLRL